MEALSFGAANIRDGGLVLLHNCTMPHDCFCIALLHNCITSHDGFPVEFGSAAAMNNVTARVVLFHKCTMPHDRFRVDHKMSANNEMGTGTQMEWSTFLNYGRLV